MCGCCVRDLRLLKLTHKSVCCVFYCLPHSMLSACGLWLCIIGRVRNRRAVCAIFIHRTIHICIYYIHAAIWLVYSTVHTILSLNYSIFCCEIMYTHIYSCLHHCPVLCNTCVYCWLPTHHTTLHVCAIIQLVILITNDCNHVCVCVGMYYTVFSST